MVVWGFTLSVKKSTLCQWHWHNNTASLETCLYNDVEKRNRNSFVTKKTKHLCVHTEGKITEQVCFCRHTQHHDVALTNAPVPSPVFSLTFKKKGSQIFQKLGSHFKILDPRRRT
jgi:hypothetical protein